MEYVVRRSGISCSEHLTACEFIRPYDSIAYRVGTFFVPRSYYSSRTVCFAKEDVVSQTLESDTSARCTTMRNPKKRII